MLDFLCPLAIVSVEGRGSPPVRVARQHKNKNMQDRENPACGGAFLPCQAVTACERLKGISACVSPVPDGLMKKAPLLETLR